jgi:hypothetical protein
LVGDMTVTVWPFLVKYWHKASDDPMASASGF